MDALKMNTRILSLVVVASLSASAFADPQSDDEASKARASQLQEEADQQKASELAKKVVDGEFRVIQVLQDGLLVSGNYKDPDTGDYQRINPIAWLEAADTSKFVEGDRFTADIRVNGAHRFTDSDGRPRKVRRLELVHVTR